MSALALLISCLEDKALDALISDIKLIIFVKVENREYFSKFDKDNPISALKFEKWLFVFRLM